MTELWLVRHGQTNWNSEGRFQGHSDEPLNETGLAQAIALAEVIEGVRLRAIYSSDLRRAYETARAVSDRFGIPIQSDPRLREVSLGAWEGMLSTDIPIQYADHWAERQKNPVHGRPPEGESVYDLAVRAWPAVDAIAARHAPGPVLLVSHGLLLATLICRAEGRPLAEAFQAIPPNAAVTVIPWQGAAASLAALRHPSLPIPAG